MIKEAFWMEGWDGWDGGMDGMDGWDGYHRLYVGKSTFGALVVTHKLDFVKLLLQY